MNSLEMTKKLNSEVQTKLRVVQENRRQEALEIQRIGTVTSTIRHSKKTKKSKG